MAVLNGLARPRKTARFHSKIHKPAKTRLFCTVIDCFAYFGTCSTSEQPDQEEETYGPQIRIRLGRNARC